MSSLKALVSYGLKEFELGSYFAKQHTLLSKLNEQEHALVSNLVVARAYRNYMKKMVHLGLVEVDGSGRWKKFQIVV